MANEPIYLVQDERGVLHGYWNREILRIDIAMNKQNPPQMIYKRTRDRLTVRYKRLIGRP